MQIQGYIKKIAKYKMFYFPILDGFFEAGPGENIVDVAKAWLEAKVYLELSAEIKFEVSVASDKKTLIAKTKQSEFLLPTILINKRRAAGLTTRELAKKLGMKSHAAIVRYENGKAEPTLAMLERILAVLGLELSVLDLQANLRSGKKGDKLRPP